MKNITLYLALKFFENKFLILFSFLTFVIISNNAIAQVTSASIFSLAISLGLRLYNFKPIETLILSRVQDDNTSFDYYFNGIRHSQFSDSVSSALKLGYVFSGIAFVNNLAINEQYPNKVHFIDSSTKKRITKKSILDENHKILKKMHFINFLSLSSYK